MSRALRISILLNVALLAGLGWSASHELKSVSVHEPKAILAAEAPAITGALPPISNPAQSEPFRWNQLYATDYHVYVKNLRAIGCPEPTLRAIVSKDVHSVVQQKVDELEKKISSAAAGSWSLQFGSRTNVEAWKAELQSLPDEETVMLADYLGDSVATSPPDSASKPSGAAVAREPISIPLIAEPVDLAALNLDQSQLQAISDLRQSFMQKIGGPNQDANDPAYQARWRAAQTETDDLMQGLLGNEAYENYQSQALAKALAKTADGLQTPISSNPSGNGESN
jgi:hypothetical protein